jgi:uncharacterized membrane protein YesL
MKIAIGISISLLVAAGVVLLQIYLSKKQNKWLGLILPGICIIISLFGVLSTPIYVNRSPSIQSIGENGEIVNEAIIIASNENKMSATSAILTIVVLFLTYNIPTIILLSIYAVCRGKIKKNLELEKMSIQDLT